MITTNHRQIGIISGFELEAWRELNAREKAINRWPNAFSANDLITHYEKLATLKGRMVANHPDWDVGSCVDITVIEFTGVVFATDIF